MKSKILLCALACAAGLGALSLTGVGCGSPCDDLQTECDKCSNEIAKAVCDAIVQADDSDACQQTVDNGVNCGDTAGPASVAASTAEATVGAGGMGGMGAGAGGMGGSGGK